MKKVGVVTLYGNYNIGNKLQHYAVMQLYRSLGYDVTAVNHIEREGLPKPPLMYWIKLAVKIALLRVNPNLRCIQNYKRHLQRRRLFLEFSEYYLRPSESVSMQRIPKDLKRRCDFFSAGSDQVWHNWTGKPEELRFFFLRFADKSQRLCLSPSFGFERVPEGQEAVYREGLNGFPRLSCRETSGVRLIRELTGGGAALLPDPTICLSAEEWEGLERKPSYPLPERYVLSYMLGSVRPETRDAVSCYARALGAEVLNINDDDLKNKTKHYAATGPQEFLYLIRHASLVCTNSFHGTVFSILFRKDFVCFQREDIAMTGDMSNRITTLLEKFHLSSRRYGVLRDEDLLSTDYAGAEETLSRERERMLDYLRESLGDTDSDNV